MNSQPPHAQSLLSTRWWAQLRKPARDHTPTKGRAETRRNQSRFCAATLTHKAAIRKRHLNLMARETEIDLPRGLERCLSTIPATHAAEAQQPQPQKNQSIR